MFGTRRTDQLDVNFDLNVNFDLRTSFVAEMSGQEWSMQRGELRQPVEGNHDRSR